jgi:hypothetical protein
MAHCTHKSLAGFVLDEMEADEVFFFNTSTNAPHLIYQHPRHQDLVQMENLRLQCKRLCLTSLYD